MLAFVFFAPALLFLLYTPPVFRVPLGFHVIGYLLFGASTCLLITSLVLASGSWTLLYALPFWTLMNVFLVYMEDTIFFQKYLARRMSYTGRKFLLYYQIEPVCKLWNTIMKGRHPKNAGVAYEDWTIRKESSGRTPALKLNIELKHGDIPAHVTVYDTAIESLIRMSNWKL